jgi:hypothetical protein
MSNVDPNQPPTGGTPPPADPGSAGAPPVPGQPPAPPPYVPPAQPPGGSYGNGGSPQSGNMISRFFEGITVADVVITSLVLCALFLIIRHYRDKIKTAKEEKDTLKNKVAEMEATVNSLVAESPAAVK